MKYNLKNEKQITTDVKIQTNAEENQEQEIVDSGGTIFEFKIIK